MTQGVDPCVWSKVYTDRGSLIIWGTNYYRCGGEHSSAPVVGRLSNAPTSAPVSACWVPLERRWAEKRQSFAGCRFVYPLAATLFRVVSMLLPVLRSLIPRTSKGSSRVHVVASAVVQVHSAPKSPINYKENMQLDYLVPFDTLFLSHYLILMEHNTTNA